MQKKILIVTNDNVFYLLLKTFIESLSYYVVCEKITNHKMISEQLHENIKLIIVDGKMVDISPIELIHQCRFEYKILSGIWFVTEVNSAAYLQKALEVGANKIIHKPIDPQEFSHEVLKFVL